jgi:hypothetical protein
MTKGKTKGRVVQKKMCKITPCEVETLFEKVK